MGGPTWEKICHPIVSVQDVLGRQNNSKQENASYHESKKERHGQTKAEGGIFIYKQVSQKIKETEQLLKVINQELENAPSGSLKIQRRGNKIYYYHQVKREGTYVKKYIEQKNKGVAIALAKKGYYEKVKPLLEKELDALETFEKSYDENMVNDLYDSMIEAIC